MDIQFNFAANLRALRAINQVSQTELAKDIGVTQTTVHLWETGVGLPRTKNLQAIADYFSVSIMTLVDMNPLLKPNYKQER